MALAPEMHGIAVAGGKGKASTVRISLIAALFLEVIIPTLLGRHGMGFFLSWLNSPSPSSFSLRRFNFKEEMPSRIGMIFLMPN